MADERKTSVQAWEAYRAAKGLGTVDALKSIDAFFEGYKAGIIDGQDTTLAILDREIIAKMQP